MLCFSSAARIKLVGCTWPLNSDCHVRLSSVALEHFFMVACVGRVEVDAPNLTFLQYCCCSGVDSALSLKNSDHIVRAELGLAPSYNSDFDGHALVLMKAVHHVKELHLWIGAVKVKHLAHSEGDRTPSYPNLVKLYICGCSYDTWRYVTYWLANSPRIETLIYGKGLMGVAWPPNAALVPFSSHVKVIEVSMFHGSKKELDLIKHLLRNAQVLRELIVYVVYMTAEEELEASKKLLMLPRASSTCVVQLRKRHL